MAKVSVCERKKIAEANPLVRPQNTAQTRNAATAIAAALQNFIIIAVKLSYHLILDAGLRARVPISKFYKLHELFALRRPNIHNY